MKERHWNSLTAALRYGQCVLVLGPEMPSEQGDVDGSRTPVAVTTIVDALSDKLATELRDDNRSVYSSTLAAVAQQYEDAAGFGASTLRAEAARFYRSGGFRPSPIHAALAQLPFSLILTTSQDALLAEALRAAGKSPIARRYNLRGDRGENPEFVVPSSPQTPMIYGLFGTATEPSSLVLSENDVLDFLIAVVSERPPLPNSLLSALKGTRQSFLFLGFGIRHWYQRILLKILIRALGLSQSGTAIAAEPLNGLLPTDLEETILFYQRGRRVEVEDCDLSAFLSELSRRLEAEGGFAGSASILAARPHVFISYAREDQALATRLYDALQQANFEPWLDVETLEGGEEWDRRIESELDVTDFALVLHTPTLCRKNDSYVNKEIALAVRRSLRVRGTFMIPLRCGDLSQSDRVPDLAAFNEMRLETETFDQDVAGIVSTMLREYQRRRR